MVWCHRNYMALREQVLSVCIVHNLLTYEIKSTNPDRHVVSNSTMFVVRVSNAFRYINNR